MKNKFIKYIAAATALTITLTAVPVRAQELSPAGPGPESILNQMKLPEAAVTDAPTQRLSGKTMSILGDSISTFGNTTPSDYNIYYPYEGGIAFQDWTWWKQLMDTTGMTLCSNASSANTMVTGSSTELNGSAPGCSFRRIFDLRGSDGSSPDIIFIFMGINDFARSVPLGTFKTPSIQTEGDTPDFAASYELMVQKAKSLYPNAEIYCSTIYARDLGITNKKGVHINNNGNSIVDFNKQIKAIAKAYGCTVADFYSCGISYENLDQYTTDGIHPNLAGTMLLAASAYKAMIR